MGSTRLAVFDLDGTLTRRDTFVPYLQGWLARHPARRSEGYNKENQLPCNRNIYRHSKQFVIDSENQLFN
jgi:phosphoserine phosphatase